MSSAARNEKTNTQFGVYTLSSVSPAALKSFQLPEHIHILTLGSVPQFKSILKLGQTLLFSR